MGGREGPGDLGVTELLQRIWGGARVLPSPSTAAIKAREASPGTGHGRPGRKLHTGKKLSAGLEQLGGYTLPSSSWPMTLGKLSILSEPQGSYVEWR